MPYETILVPVDPAGCAGELCAHARQLAQAFGSRVTLLHVIATPPGVHLADESGGGHTVAEALEDEARAELSALQRLFPLGTAEILVRYGEIAATIRQVASERGAQLVVMGTHGRTGLRRLVLGSVAEQVLRSCPAPVLVVHAPPGTADAHSPAWEQARAETEG